MIVHTSYAALAGTGLNLNEIIDSLLDFVGVDGTLAMMADREYKEMPKLVLY